ncbi:MAG: asparagine synthase C-terminal domain-containing protein [Haloferacaceae archaeon]
MRGAPPGLVRDARRRGDPLPGTAGFAGRLDGALVRDVLGREPLFSEAGDPAAWSHDPTDLADPDPVPAGHRRTDGGDRRLWTLPTPDPDDPGAALDRVRAAVLSSVDGAEADAVAFSGGVDSALVASGLPDATCYVAGFEGAHDPARAREAAAALGRDLRVVTLDHADLRRAVRAVVAATGRTNAMDVAIAATLYPAAAAAAADGHDRIALGQGADELFGGYAKVAELDDRVAADSVRGAVRETIRDLPAGLERDVLAVRAAGVDPAMPLLHDRVVAAALALPADLLVDPDGAERKVALRRVARERVGAAAEADKKAAQYGSYVARELDRLARRAGFKRRMDDHVRRYVESLTRG